MFKKWITTEQGSVINPQPYTATKPSPKSTYKKKTNPKKRGPKTSKVVDAFKRIPHIPVSIEVFSQETGVSIGVLRQAKRFDKSGLPGKVHITRTYLTDLDTEKTTTIWREKITYS